MKGTERRSKTGQPVKDADHAGSTPRRKAVPFFKVLDARRKGTINNEEVHLGHWKRHLVTLRELEALCQTALTATVDGQPLKNGWQLADYLRLMAFCGSRRSETLHLKWQDVDWAHHQLTISSERSRTHQPGRVRRTPRAKGPPKGGPDRTTGDDPPGAPASDRQEVRRIQPAYRPGRRRIAPTIEELVLQFARENRTLGYRRILGALRTWGIKVATRPTPGG